MLPTWAGPRALGMLPLLGAMSVTYIGKCLEPRLVQYHCDGSNIAKERLSMTRRYYHMQHHVSRMIREDLMSFSYSTHGSL